ncbi:MAG: hypothetical protein A2297_03870 [Elusimicrobia bacterium RIFOXYB2_FULL_48_7]|nr:MAG: hypothetical protein A2297_03870 [Elusimicrobia bacterium RIFOXYB2_FULL_48_7]
MNLEHKKMKILIVDDEANIRELLKINLEAKGYAVFEAANGKEALKQYLFYKPDLIILDVMMPEIDGWEVCKAIKDNSEIENTKIIILSSKSHERDVVIGKGIFKADEYMTKPFELENILLKVEELLREK